MAEGRQRSDWSRTSAMLALFANANRDPRKTGPFKPADFDPYACPECRRGAAAGQADMSLLKDYVMGLLPRKAGRSGDQTPKEPSVQVSKCPSDQVLKEGVRP